MGTTATALNDRVVNTIFRDCLVRDGDDQSKVYPVQHITYEIARFSQDRIDQHRQEIHNLVSQLPEKFNNDGGASFIGTRLNRIGERWTRFEQIQERLVQLGVAIGEIEFVDPRSTWPTLAEGKPRIVIKQ